MENENLTPEQEGEEVKTYTEEEVQSMISKAVNGAVSKAKSKANKSSEERITELEREIAKRDNQEYARTQMLEKGIDISLAPLIYSGTNEETDSKIELLSQWYTGAVEKALKEKIRESKPIKLSGSDTKKGRKSLAELQNEYDNK